MFFLDVLARSCFASLASLLYFDSAHTPLLNFCRLRLHTSHLYTLLWPPLLQSPNRIVLYSP
jgi:hypothetical protein